jgi:hypothetical protein
MAPWKRAGAPPLKSCNRWDHNSMQEKSTPRSNQESSNTAAQELEFDVLPAHTGDSKTDLSRLIAWILDDLIRVPGTNFRVGLDPIVGLVPGLGDGSTAVFSSVILLQSLRAGVPRIVIVRMALNILINSLLGAAPGIGDLFYALLQKHAGTARTSTRADWVFVVALISSVVAIGIGVSLFVALVTVRLLAWLFGF